jgi:hypothetical protein
LGSRFRVGDVERCSEGFAEARALSVQRMRQHAVNRHPSDSRNLFLLRRQNLILILRVEDADAVEVARALSRGAPPHVTFDDGRQTAKSRSETRFLERFAYCSR